MNKNIFFNKNQKFNPDIKQKFSQKKREREEKYKFKNIIDKPIINKKLVVDTNIDLKKRRREIEKERSQLDSELIKKKYSGHNNIPVMNYNPKNIISSKNTRKSSKKADKILEDLKKLGILK
tara:strand:- start:1165 stop:1530 length:366 start_codon:yes stop_codon:yes gene_type:complete